LLTKEKEAKRKKTHVLTHMYWLQQQ